MTDTPTEMPAGTPQGIKIPPMDWRAGGFVAVHRAQFPDDDPTAHRVVKWYNDEPVTRVHGSWPASDVIIRPACMDPDPEAGYMEMTPLYAQARGAVWCRECFQDVGDA